MEITLPPTRLAARATIALRRRRIEDLRDAHGPLTRDQYCDLYVAEDLDYDRLVGADLYHRRYGLVP